MINTTFGLSGGDCWMPVAEDVIRSNAAASVVIGRIGDLSAARSMRQDPQRYHINWIRGMLSKLLSSHCRRESPLMRHPGIRRPHRPGILLHQSIGRESISFSMIGAMVNVSM